MRRPAGPRRRPRGGAFLDGRRRLVEGAGRPLADRLVGHADDEGESGAAVRAAHAQELRLGEAVRIGPVVTMAVVLVKQIGQPRAEYLLLGLEPHFDCESTLWSQVRMVLHRRTGSIFALSEAFHTLSKPPVLDEARLPAKGQVVPMPGMVFGLGTGVESPEGDDVFAGGLGCGIGFLPRLKITQCD